MFYINSETQKPNHALALQHAEAWCQRGFKFNREAWSEITALANQKKEQLIKYGLKKPDSPKQIEWFLRSFNSLEIAAFMYDMRKGGWGLTVEALCEVADKFTGIPEIKTLYEYKKAMATARSFQTLEKYLVGGDVVHPKVKTTSTNRIMFVEPFLSGLPKHCSPFAPMSETGILLSVDVKAQEPNILINWFGSKNLKDIASTETDIYTGVAKAAFIPKVSLIEGSGSSTTAVAQGIAWTWGKGDTLRYIENVHQSKLLEPPEYVTGVFESGKSRKLPVRWAEGGIKKETLGELALTPEMQSKFTFSLLGGARNEVKEVWSLLAYGGSLGSAKEHCVQLDGDTLVGYLKKELRVTNTSGAEFQETYFGTQLISDERLNYRSVRNRMIQGTGADLTALLIERFYSQPRPSGVDIYLTRYDELVLEVPWEFFKGGGLSAGVKEYFTEIFEHQVDDFTPFRVSIDLF